MADIAREAGISRQALYLHFGARSDLLRATTLYIDELHGVDRRLAASRAANRGVDRLSAFIDAWGNYMPHIQGVARALLAMQETDPDAAAVWAERMNDMREGCAAAIDALANDADLHDDWQTDVATDLLWTNLSFRNWDYLRSACGWTQDEYIQRMQYQARSTFVKTAANG